MFLNATPFRQPHPLRNPGGDCFACAFKVVIDYCYPEKPISFDEAWECFESHYGCSRVDCKDEEGKASKRLTNYWTGLYSACQVAYSKGYYLDWEIDLVHPNINEDRFSHNFGWQVPEMKWHRRVENWLKSGWIILTEISLESLDVVKDRGNRNKYTGSDHFVVIDGQRSFWKEDFTSDGKRFGTGKHETHVVCSAKGPYWIDTGDLHYFHGVNGFYAIRRQLDRQYRDYSWNESPENQAKIDDR